MQRAERSVDSNLCLQQPSVDWTEHGHVTARKVNLVRFRVQDTAKYELHPVLNLL